MDQLKGHNNIHKYTYCHRPNFPCSPSLTLTYIEILNQKIVVNLELVGNSKLTTIFTFLIQNFIVVVSVAFTFLEFFCRILVLQYCNYCNKYCNTFATEIAIFIAILSASIVNNPGFFAKF